MTQSFVAATPSFAPNAQKYAQEFAQGREISMQTVVQNALPHAVSARPASIWSALFLGLSWPFFVVIESCARVIGRIADPSHRPSRSIVAEANENASIAVSYALLARRTLQNSARTPRSEHRS